MNPQYVPFGGNFEIQYHDISTKDDFRSEQENLPPNLYFHFEPNYGMAPLLRNIGQASFKEHCAEQSRSIPDQFEQKDTSETSSRNVQSHI